MIFPKIWVGPYYYLIVPENKHNLKVNLYLHSDLTWGTQIRKYMEREDAEEVVSKYIQKELKPFSDIISNGFRISKGVYDTT